MELTQTLYDAYASLRSQISIMPRAALILGTNLNPYASHIRVVQEIPFHSIRSFPTSSAPGHRGCFLIGYIGTLSVIVMQGRVHFYEGYSMQQVVMPVRLMKLLGAELLVCTNTSGGITPGFSAGSIAVIKDHISSFIPSPLIGKNVDELGKRFPGMTNAYDPELRRCMLNCAERLGIGMKEAVYLQLTGPQFETPAEQTFYRMIGADIVGMSTACEIIAARHMGMRACGLSYVSNIARGVDGHIDDYSVVKAIKDKALPQIYTLLDTFFASIE